MYMKELNIINPKFSSLLNIFTNDVNNFYYGIKYKVIDTFIIFQNKLLYHENKKRYYFKFKNKFKYMIDVITNISSNISNKIINIKNEYFIIIINSLDDYNYLPSFITIYYEAYLYKK